MRLSRWFLVLTVLPLAACATSMASRSVMTVSPDVVSLAKETMPGGEFVMEIADDGKVLGMEAKVPLSSVPAACREAAQRLAPNGRAVAAVKEIVDGKVLYEIQMDAGGFMHEILLDPAGNLAGREDVLKPGDYPANIVSAAQAAVPGTLVSVERIEGPESRLGSDYHVKIRIPEGEVLKVCVSGDGKVGRVLRKIDAEIQAER